MKLIFLLAMTFSWTFTFISLYMLSVQATPSDLRVPQSLSSALLFLQPPIPTNIILPLRSLEGLSFGVEKENITYLAAVTMLRGGSSPQ